MQVEIASAPARPWPRLSWARAAHLVLPLTIAVTLLFELALAERKYALFGGGFGQSRPLDTALEIGAFATALLACQTAVLWLLYRLLRRLHGRRADTPLFHLNFLFFVGVGALGIVAAKFQALTYFSDAMSFEIVRNLGGGSLTTALLYSLSEISLALIATAGSFAVYAGGLLALRRRWRHAPPLSDRTGLSPRGMLLAAAALPVILFGAERIDGARSALAVFNSVMLVETVLHQATDWDRDGWSLFSHPIDRQPFDAARHPYALDVPNNGVDEDGFGGDLAVTAAPEEPAPAVIAGRKRHVILIVLESTRADSIGRRIDGRPVAPTLEALAVSGSSAAEAYSHVGFTSYSLRSLFTGQLAPTDDRTSMIRDFIANGYHVGVFSGQSENFGDIARVTGMRRADTFVDATTLRSERASGFATDASIKIDGRILLREFDRRFSRPEAWRRPNFLYFNFQSAHFPYWWPGMERIFPGEPIPRGRISAANREWVAHTYWNAVAYEDRLVGALIARLRRLGVLDDALIIATADHGESLFDDGFLGHGHALNAQQTHIPFILSDPGVELEGPVGLADMRGIILRAAGAELPPPPRRRGVFQYLGTLDRPGAIGLVERGGRWTIFELFGERTWSSRTGRWTGYAALPPAEKARTDALIDEWARQRWLQRTQASR